MPSTPLPDRVVALLRQPNPAVSRVISIADDEGLRDIDRIARHYTGSGYRDRRRPRVSARVEIDRWHAWGALRDR
jgi:hypothetical protein